MNVTRPKPFPGGKILLGLYGLFLLALLPAVTVRVDTSAGPLSQVAQPASSAWVTPAHAATPSTPTAPAPQLNVTDPRAVVTGPKTVAVGKLGKYECQMAGKSFQWLILPEEAKLWFTPILTDNMDGTYGRAGLLIPDRVIPVYINFIATEGDKSVVATVTVNEGATPSPMPGPVPVTPPGPAPLPDVSGDTWSQWAMATATKDVQTTVEERASVAHRLADAFTAACKACTDGNVTDDLTARQTLAKKTFDVCSADERKAWMLFSADMDLAVSKAVTAGTIKSVSDRVKVWASIASGLRAL